MSSQNESIANRTYRPITESPGMGFLHKKKKAKSDKEREINGKNNIKSSENAGNHAVVRRIVRDRSVSNLQTEPSRTGADLDTETDGLNGGKKRKSSSPPSRAKRKTSDIVKSKLNSFNSHSDSNRALRATSETSEKNNASNQPVNDSPQPSKPAEPNLGSARLSTKGSSVLLRSDKEDNENEQKAPNGVFSSILSAAHNAANHLLPKPNAEKTSPSETSQHAVETLPTVPTPHKAEQQDQAPNSSFLKHLDFLLASSPMGQNQNESNNLLSPNYNPRPNDKSSLSSSLARLESEYSGAPSIVVNEPDGSASGADTDLGSVTEKIHFRSLRGEPPIATLGRGNLTLDALASTNISDTSLEEEPMKNEDEKRSSFPQRGRSLNSSGNRDKELAYNIETSLGDVMVKSPSPVRSDPGAQSSISLDKNGAASGSNAQQRTLEEKKQRKRASTMRPRSLHQLSLRAVSSRGVRNSLQRNRSLSHGEAGPGGQVSVQSNDSASALTEGTRKHEVRSPRGSIHISERKQNEFHSLFKESGVSSSESLLADYSCALSRDILLHGRMYISWEHVCFNSSILGWVTNVIIPFKEIVQIEKKSTAGIFPNGMVFQTLHSRYTFASIMSRDAAFDFITSIWNQTIEDSDVRLKMGGMNSTSPRSSNSTLDSHSESEAQLSSETSSEGYSSGEETSDESLTDDGHGEDDDYNSRPDLSEIANGEFRLSRKQKISTLGPEQHSPTSGEHLTAADDRVIAETVFEAPLGKIVNLLYGDNVSYTKKILEAQKNYDLSKIPPIMATHERTYNYVKPLGGSIGPSKTGCEITETIDHYDLEDYVKVVQVSKTPDVPSGNSFLVVTSLYYSWAPRNCTKLIVAVNVKWTGKSWLKAAIEKHTFDGVTTTTKTMIEEINKIIHGKESKGAKESNETPSSEDAYTQNLPTAGPSEHAKTSSDYTKEDGDVVITDSLVIPAPLGTVHQLLFGDDTSYLQRILEKQGNYDISTLPQFKDGKREYQYTKPLSGPVGPKKTKCYIEEKVERNDLESQIIVRQITKTPDVPSGSSFSVNTKLHLYWGSNNQTNILVVSNVVWTAKSWIKSAVEKGSLDGQKSSIAVMGQELKDIVAEAGTTKKGHIRRTTKSKPKKPKAAVSSSKSTEAPRSSTGLSLDTALEWFMNLSLPYQVLIFLFALVSTIVIIARFASSRHGASAIVGPGRIMIGGETYNYAPTLDTLYGTFDRDVRASRKSSKAWNVVTASESELWEWIKDRSTILQENHSPDYARRRMSLHARQDLEETIRLAEVKLDELRSYLNTTTV
ncbi:LAFA_0G18580g1_1 [Lachancea sp. 'fantastica']|nr:LAFA_0G18580g1_1 [Lachancea sp. 'fantastica']